MGIPSEKAPTIGELVSQMSVHRILVACQIILQEGTEAQVMMGQWWANHDLTRTARTSTSLTLYSNFNFIFISRRQSPFSPCDHTEYIYFVGFLLLVWLF